MAMGSSGGGEGLSSEINVTPLIDVLLVLLIIFMITQPLSRKAFDVQTPKPQKGAKDKPSSQIVLELKVDGSYAINGQPYTLNQLDQAFHQIYDPRPARRAARAVWRRAPDSPCGCTRVCALRSRSGGASRLAGGGGRPLPAP